MPCFEVGCSCRCVLLGWDGRYGICEKGEGRYQGGGAVRGWNLSRGESFVGGGRKHKTSAVTGGAVQIRPVGGTDDDT